MAKTVNFFKGASGIMPGEWELQNAQIERQRQIAQALQQQSQDMPEGQMVSGHYVAPSFTQYLAKGLQGYTASKKLDEADQRQHDILQAQNDKVAEAVKGFGDVYNPNQVDLSQQETPTENPDGSTSYGATPMMDNKGAAYAYLLQHPEAAQNPLISAQIPSLTPKAPEDYTLAPGAARYRGNEVIASNQKPADNKPIVIGNVAYDPVTYKPVIEGKDKPAAPTELERLLTFRDSLPPNDPRRQTVDAAISKQTTHAPAANVTTTVSNSPEKAFSVALAKSDADRIDALRTAAASSNETLGLVKRLRGTAAKGVYSGGLAETKMDAANFLSGIGVDVDVNKLANSQSFDSDVNNLVLSKIKTLGTNPSDADRAFIARTVPNLTKSAKAREDMLNYLEAKAQRAISTYKRADSYARRNQSLGGFDEFQTEDDLHSAADKIINGR